MAIDIYFLLRANGKSELDAVHELEATCYLSNSKYAINCLHDESESDNIDTCII